MLRVAAQLFQSVGVICCCLKVLMLAVACEGQCSLLGLSLLLGRGGCRFNKNGGHYFAFWGVRSWQLLNLIM